MGGVALAVWGGAAACGGAMRPPRGFPEAPAATPDTASYELAWDDLAGELHATLALPAGLASSLDVERDLSPWVDGAVTTEGGGTRALRGQRGDGYGVPECARAPCTVRYRVRLREAARTLDDLDTAKLLGARGEVVLGTPPAFLLAPWGASAALRVRFRVRTAPGTAFVTGVFPARDGAGVSELAMDDLASAPYSAFGPLTLRTVSAPGGELALALVPGAYSVTEDDLVAWVQASARAVSSYYGGMPMPREAVLLVPSSRGAVGFGKSLAGGGATVFVGVGPETTKRALAEDWVLTHELVHAAFPALPRELDWVEEGLATYVEPLARARTGAQSELAVWRGMVSGLRFGNPEPGDRGLDRTHTWGRVYWGGALFFLIADLEIRRKTGGRSSLREALQAILRELSSNAHKGELARAFAVGDRATGTEVLSSLHAAWAETPVTIDLAALYASLGVRVGPDGEVSGLDDAAPEAALRRALTAP